MKDLYKALAISPGASDREVRQALVAPGIALSTETRAAVEQILLDPKRRSVYDRSHRVLTTIASLRSRLGLSYKPFWSRGGFEDFTREPMARPRRRRVIDSLRPADISRAFGLVGGARRQNEFDRERQQKMLVAAICLFAAAAVVGAITLYQVSTWATHR